MGRFRHKSTLFLILCAFALSVTAQEPIFRASTKLVRLIVSVKDEKGQPIGTLEKSNFSVTDSGVAQTVSVFEHHTEVPLSVSLLLDVSGSTGKDLAYEVESLKKFIRALLKEGNPADSIALYSFDSDVTQLRPFTRNEVRLRSALDGIKPSGGTSLFDAAYLAARQIESRDGRHVLVIVTDGGDTTSKQNFQSSLRTVQLSEAVVYPILVTPITTDPGRNLGGERVLAQYAEYTGGRVFEPSKSDQLDHIFTEILRDLRTQYLLGYYPSNLPAELPAFHPVRVTLNRPELKVSTRSGYYEDSKQR
jgi:Ca-activated chloride channel homolog